MAQVSEVLMPVSNVRTFKDKPLGEEKVLSLLKAAMSVTPKEKNPLHLVVLRDRKNITRIPEFHPWGVPLLKAPLAIGVCGDSTKESREEPWFLLCAAAMERMIIQAYSQGFGTAKLGCYPQEERMKALEELLEVPSGIRAFGVLGLGYPTERLALEEWSLPTEKIHVETWSSPI